MDKFGRKVQWDVKRSVYTASAFYFFYYGGKACLFPFISLYFKQMGLSASQAGLVFGIRSMLWYCASPIWMAVALRVRKTRTILCYSIFIVIGSNLALTLLPPANPEVPYQICLHETPTWYSNDNWTTSSGYELTINETDGTPLLQPTIASINTTAGSDNNYISLVTTNTQNAVTTPALTSTTTTTTLPPASEKKSSAVVSQSTPSQLTVYQMAKKLVPVMTAKGYTSKNADEVARFIAEYGETSNWIEWKQRTLKEKILSFLPQPTKFESPNSSQGDGKSHEEELERLAKFIYENFIFGKTGATPTKEWLDDILAKADSRLSEDQKATVLKKLKQRVNKKKGKSSKKSDNEGWNTNLRRGRARRSMRVRRDEEDGNQTSYLYDAIHSINLTSLSETGKEKLHNLTHTLRNLAEELGPYLSSNTTLFLCVLIILVAGEFLSAPIELVSDDSLYKLLDELDSLNQYGKHRMAALVGASLASMSVCIMVYYSPCYLNGNINRFHIHFYIFALLLGISFMLAPFYPSYEPRNDSTKNRISSGARRTCPTCSPMICSSCRHFLLLITVFVVGVSQAPIQNFLLWSIQDMDGASELVYGSYVSVNALCAMLSSLCARPLIKMMKPCTVGFISLMSIALQLLLFAFVSTPWLIVPLQLLNITGQSFLWAIVSHHTSTTMSSAYESSNKISEVHVFARASQQRSLHTAYVSVYQGLSFSIGSIISGFLFDFCSGDMTPIFLGNAALVAAWGLIFAFYQCCCWPRKMRRKYSHLVSDSDSEIDQAENTEFSLKSTEKNGNYVSNYYSVRDGKKKKGKGKKISRTQKETDSSSDDDKVEETDWLTAASRKDSRML